MTSAVFFLCGFLSYPVFSSHSAEIEPKLLEPPLAVVPPRIDGLLDEGIPIEIVGTTIIFDMDARFAWSPSKKTEIRRELKELRETAGENYREQIETFVLENIIAKIPQLRTSGTEK